MSQSEIEAKLEVPSPEQLPRAAAIAVELGFHAEPPQLRRLHDRYLDTPGRQLLRSGWALRLRQGGAESLLTLKACRPVSADGLAVREEVEEVVDATDPARLPEGALGGRLAALRGGEDLRPLFELQQTRTARRLEGADGLAVELCADEVEWRRADGSTDRACVVELELLDGPVDGLRALVGALAAATGWATARWSKFERGLG
jgi:triphosphatase